MLSTLWGLLLGIVIAALVTVFYGDRFNALLRELAVESTAITAVPQPAAASRSGNASAAVETRATPATARERQQLRTPSSGTPSPGTLPSGQPPSVTSRSANTRAAIAVPGKKASVAAASSAPQPGVPLPGSHAADATAAAAAARAPQAELPASTAAQTGVRAEAGSTGETTTATPASTLARKWADYAARADSLEPRGDFRWRECFTRAAAAHAVPETLLLALASGESGFDPAARSAKDAVGLMQIRWPQTSRHLGIHHEADLYDPCTNISAGARYIAELSRRYDNDLHRAVAAYNYGPGRINSGAMPAGARWYSQYIYQHLQKILGQPHTPSSELLAATSPGAGGFDVLVSFNQAFRARDFIAYLQRQEPTLDLAQRSETLGRHEVVMLYDNAQQRRAALEAIGRSGINAAAQ